MAEPPPQGVYVYKNNGDNTFTDIKSSTGINPQGSTFSISAGDYDKDDDLDLAIAQYGNKPIGGAGNFES